MESRRNRYKKDAKSKKSKLIISTLFLTFGIGNSVNIAFADEDIQSMVTKWFDTQKTKSIATIEEAILSEKEIQMKRLKEELRIEINSAEEELNSFTETEKEKRVNSIQKHATKLSKNLKIVNSEEEKKIRAELDAIVAESINNLENAVKEEKKPTAKIKETEPKVEPAIEPETNDDTTKEKVVSEEVPEGEVQ